MHAARILVLVVLLIVCTTLPYLPGQYDRLAVPLSTAAQALSAAGVLLLPLACTWLAIELRHHAVRAAGRTHGHAGRWLGWTAAAAWSAVGALLSLAAFLGRGVATGTAALALLTFALASASRHSRRSQRKRAFDATPLYLTVVPVLVAPCQFLLLPRVADWSRQRAIENSVELLGAIERYRETRGSYPLSLLALHQDYEPGVIGVERYAYEPNRDAFDVYFEQLSTELGAREIVMYNPRDEHDLPSHDSDLLLWTPEERRARPGHNSVHPTPIPHWKYFLFD